MALSLTIVWKRGLITMEERDRILNLMSRVGLTLDHDLLNIDLVWKATKLIMLTCDGHQRAAMPNPICDYVFLNDLTYEEFKQALQEYKRLIQNHPRHGQGLDAFVDQNDYLDEICEESDTVILTKIPNGEIILRSMSSMNSTSTTTTDKGYSTVMYNIDRIFKNNRF